VAVLAAVGYCVAFLPPERLRRLWEATAAYRHSERLYAAPSSASPSVLWTDLANTAAQLTGAGVVVLESMRTRDRDEAGPTAIAAASADLDVATGVPVAMPGVGNAEAESAERALIALTGRRVATTVQIGDGAPGQAIVLLRDRPSLFDADDSSLVRALAIRSSDLVARRRALAEQERLAGQLAETVTALEGASAAKSDFLANMSHELRTPLNAIIGFSELMIREPGEEDVTVPREWVERIRTQGGHLVGLINDLLDLAKIEAGHLEIAQEPVLLAAAVEESVAGVKPLADRKNQVVDVQVDGLVVSADPGRLRQVLYNLLSNAIKFTPDGGRIEVTGEIGDGDVRLRLADNGVGIAAESLGAIFQEFEQVGETSAREGGTGLGLALTRRIVEAHGGHIEVESELGRGSCFTVVLSPATIDHPAVVIDPEDDDSPWSGDEVLIIEDDPSSLRLLETYLAGGPYTVRGAPTGAAGLAHARRHRPAAILLDILLPDMDGWEVLRQLKSDEQLREVPVVIVTVVDERSVGLALGAADYLLKPIEPVTLLHALERVGLSPRTRTEAAIVAIDDDPVALDLLEANLRPLGYTVVRAGSGDAGLRAASTMHPDLVICDLMMPGMDGFEVVARLKENEDTAAIPILILTAHDLTGEEKARLNGRILGVVTKGEAAATGLQKWLAQAVGQALNVSGAPA
jgi:signal transduction histidine kinase/DNA-binding response OmpR family regulator